MLSNAATERRDLSANVQMLPRWSFVTMTASIKSTQTTVLLANQLRKLHAPLCNFAMAASFTGSCTLQLQTHHRALRWHSQPNVNLMGVSSITRVVMSEDRSPTESKTIRHLLATTIVFMFDVLVFNLYIVSVGNQRLMMACFCVHSVDARV